MKQFTYTGHVYYNRGGNYTGWIKASTRTAYFKFIGRAGYETREAAQAYVDRWLVKLAKRCPLTNTAASPAKEG